MADGYGQPCGQKGPDRPQVDHTGKGGQGADGREHVTVGRSKARREGKQRQNSGMKRVACYIDRSIIVDDIMVGANMIAQRDWS